MVDCIIGGSPCQDLSVAGKRAGLAGERSGLYMEQIRIIKEMRHKDELRGRTGESIRPRYMVWENVPGAFSSNQGKDFAAVLEEAIKVAEPEAPDVPVPEKGWPTSGCIMGDSWSVAWRVLDAQFWGVPQRRRRIALVADFGGQSAPEILFVRKSLSGNPDESQQTRKATAGDAENRSGTDDRTGIAYTLKIRGGCSGRGKGALIQTDRSATLSTLQDQTLFQPILDDQGGSQISVRHDGKCPTLRAETHGNLPCVMEPVAYSINHQGGNIEQIIEDKTGTLTAAMNSSGNNKLSVAYSIENHPADSRVNIDESGKVQTLTSRMGTGGGNVPMVMESVAYGIQGSMIGRADHNGPQGDGVNEDVSFTLNTTDRHAVCYNIGSYHSNAWKSDNPNSGVYEADKSKTLDALQCGYPGCNQGGTAVVEPITVHGETITGTLLARDYKGAGRWDSLDKVVCIDRAFFNQGQNAQYAPQCYEDGTVPTLVAKGPSAVAHGVDCRNATEYEEQIGTLQADCYHNHNSNNVVRVRYIVRRLTPLECERLQGFPDGWTDIGEWVDSKGKKHKEADSPRYKALGNSIAIPPWKWVLKRICACYERDATMASLFDGIGGFPYIWEQLNGKGSCLWAAEIEEFPMAVTKLRFGGSHNG